jgi:hypothetical protein
MSKSEASYTNSGLPISVGQLSFHLVLVEPVDGRWEFMPGKQWTTRDDPENFRSYRDWRDITWAA